MSALKFATDTAGVDEICLHLTACNAEFVPPLDQRVQVADYAARLAGRSRRFEAWDGARLVGLVAVYCNDPERTLAHVSNVSVDPGFQRLGIARELLVAAVRRARDLGFARIELQADQRAASALSLYKSLGFATAHVDGTTVTMHIELGRKPE